MKSDFTVIHSSILHLKQNGLSKFEIQTHYSFQQSHPRFQLTVFYHINYMVHIGERYFLIDPVNQFDRLFIEKMNLKVDIVPSVVYTVNDLEYFTVRPDK